MVWSHEQIEQWHRRWEAYLVDAPAVMFYGNIDQQRRAVQQDMIHLLHAFLDGTITVKAFNSAFQQKTHLSENAFNLRGMSGGMFFNKLVKYIPDEALLAHHLRSVLAVPQETRDGQ